MGARIQAGAAARHRAADGMDELERHEAADPSAVRQQGGGDRLLRAPRHPVPGIRAQRAGAPHHRLRRQFCFQPTDPLDALAEPIGALTLAVQDDSHGYGRGTWFWARRIACHTRSGVAGISTWSMPSGTSASTMAFITAASAPTVPASPAPFAPSGLAAVMISLFRHRKLGQVAARGMA